MLAQELCHLHNVVFGRKISVIFRVIDIATMSNSKTAMRRLDGIIPVIEDWHTEVLLYKVSAYILFRIYLNDVLYTLRSFGNIIMMLGLVKNILHCIHYAIVLTGPML